VHRGYRRRGDVIDLCCGMSGYVPDWGRTWLRPTDSAVSCKLCLRALRRRTEEGEAEALHDSMWQAGTKGYR